MPIRSVLRGSLLRDLALIVIAVSVGWWWRGSGKAVMAQRSGASSGHSSSASDGDLAFQLTGLGPQAVLALYNPGNHTIYVYPRVGEGNSYVSCAYSFTIVNPGAPIKRDNCPVGELTPQH